MLERRVCELAHFLFQNVKKGTLGGLITSVPSIEPRSFIQVVNTQDTCVDDTQNLSAIF